MTTPMQQIVWGLSGISEGAGPFIEMTGTNSILAGKTNFGAVKQTFSLWGAARQSFEALNSINHLFPVSIPKKIILLAIMPLPFALQILLNYTSPSSCVYRTSNFIRKNLSKVILAVNLCASAIIATTAPRIFSICFTASIAIELAKESRLLSNKIRKIWEKVSIGIKFLQTLGSPSLARMTLSECAWVASELIIHVYEHYIAYNPPKMHHQATPEKATELLNLPIDRLVVNTEHLDWDPKLGFPDPKDPKDSTQPLNICDTMQGIVLKFNWGKYLTDAQRIIFHNPEFALQHPDINHASDIPLEMVKKIILDHANVLANQVQNAVISKGDHEVRYERIQYMMRLILQELDRRASHPQNNQQSIHDDFEPFLLQLIENMDVYGGCVVGIFEPVESLFSSLILGGDDSALPRKILYRLLKKRKSWFDHYIKGPLIQILMKLPKGIYEPSDRHANNILDFYPDKFLQLHSENLQNDMTVEDFFCDHLKQFFVSIFGQIAFWPLAIRSNKWYSPQAILNGLQMESEDTRFNIKQLHQWLLNWATPIHQVLTAQELDSLNQQDLHTLRKSIFVELYNLSQEVDQQQVLDDWKLLPKSDLAKLFIVRLTDEKRNLLLEMVEKNQVFGEEIMIQPPIELQNLGISKATSVINPKILKLILLDMGVLNQ